MMMMIDDDDDDDDDDFDLSDWLIDWLIWLS